MRNKPEEKSSTTNKWLYVRGRTIIQIMRKTGNQCRYQLTFSPNPFDKRLGIGVFRQRHRGSSACETVESQMCLICQCVVHGVIYTKSFFAIPFSKSCMLYSVSKISKVSSRLCLASFHPFPSVNQTKVTPGIFLISFVSVL